MVAPNELELRFHHAMLAIYEDAKRDCGYNATRFRKMVAVDGGLQTAKTLLATELPSDGFIALFEHQRLDLTVENLVLKPEFQALFSKQELLIAKERLIEYGFLQN